MEEAEIEMNPLQLDKLVVIPLRQNVGVTIFLLVSAISSFLNRTLNAEYRHVQEIRMNAMNTATTIK
jgi:hypothetical protein